MRYGWTERSIARAVEEDPGSKILREERTIETRMRRDSSILNRDSVSPELLASFYWLQ